MYCPECGLEYREGIATCSDCGVALVPDPPEAAEQEPEPEWLDLETVLESPDPALLLVVQSLLEAEEIPCFARGAGLQEFLGWGRMPSGVNLITGPVQLQVPKERIEEARALLAASAAAGTELPADEPVEE